MSNEILRLPMARWLMVSVVAVTVTFIPSLGLSAVPTFTNVQVNQVFPGPFPKE